MSGVMAGSASKDVPEYGTHTLVMTTNNLCNLECGHCYLQYDSKGSPLISNELIDAAVNSSVKHLALVGKEAFVNGRSAEITKRITESALSKGKTVSIISNGINLPNYLTRDFPKPTFVDISFDGGPESYKITRHNKTGKDFYSMAFAGAKRVLDLGIPLSVLHTIHSKNIGHLDDLMTPVLELDGLQRAMFSPYITTQNDGVNDVNGLTIEKTIEELSQTTRFMDYKNSHLFLDTFTSPRIEEKIDRLSHKYGMNEKTIVIPKEVLAQIMRLNYNGKVLTPQESVHTSLYNGLGYNFSPKTEKLDDVLERIRRRNVREIFSSSNGEGSQLNQTGGI